MCGLQKEERSKNVMKFDRFLEITLDLECLIKFKNTWFYAFWYAWWLPAHLKCKQSHYGFDDWVLV